MAHFTDSQGRRWSVELTVGDVKRVRARTGVDLMGLLDDYEDSKKPLVDRLRDDIELLIDVLFAVVECRATELGVDDGDFGRSLDGEAAGAAIAAFWSAVADFFRPLRPQIAVAAERVMALRAVATELLSIVITVGRASSLAPTDSGGSSGDARALPDSSRTA